MDNNQAYSERATENNGTRKWWYRRWVKITIITFVVLIIFAVTLALVLKVVIPTPRKPETATVPPSLITIALSTSLTTTTHPLRTTTIPLTIPTTRRPQSSTTTTAASQLTRTTEPQPAITVSTSATTIANTSEPEKQHDMVGTIEPGSGPWGTFTDMVYCGRNTWAIGFRQRVEKPRGILFDDTALNALELLCGKRDGISVNSIKTHNGFWGEWSNFAHCPGENNFLKGVSFKIEPSQGNSDDTAANDSQFDCSKSSNIRASNGAPWGDWTEMKYCPPLTAICGFSLKLEDKKGNGDDTALNGAKFACCTL